MAHMVKPALSTSALLITSHILSQYSRISNERKDFSPRIPTQIPRRIHSLCVETCWRLEESLGKFHRPQIAQGDMRKTSNPCLSGLNSFQNPSPLTFVCAAVLFLFSAQYLHEQLRSRYESHTYICCTTLFVASATALMSGNGLETILFVVGPWCINAGFLLSILVGQSLKYWRRARSSKEGSEKETSYQEYSGVQKIEERRKGEPIREGIP